MIIYYIFQIILLSLLGLASMYIFLFAIAGCFYRQKKYTKPSRLRKIAILIPGYKEDEVIIEVAQSALQQQYPMSLFDVVIIADSFQTKTLEKLKTFPVKLIEVSFETSTKSKALNMGMSLIDGNYDIAVVLDADNIMERNFLTKINAAFENGATVVQGHRLAKNKNNNWAILDTISEEINNHIFRKGHRAMGLSSALIGSGMAFQYNYFKSMMSTVDAVGGFDKEIELKMLKENITIEYLNDAIIYDEKIQQAEVFSNQRRRWLSAQFHYFRTGFLDSAKHLLLKGNIDYFNKAMQFIQPPRILLLGANILLSMVFITANLITKTADIYSYAWLAISTGCIISLAISIPKNLRNRNTLAAVAGLPKGMWLMLCSLLKIKNANKKFIHTKHSSGSVNIQ